MLRKLAKYNCICNFFERYKNSSEKNFPEECIYFAVTNSS